MSLGENIYRLRTAKNMSQGDLADALDVSRQSVSKWENNSAVPELDKLIKMGGIFGISLDELVGKESPAQPQPESAEPVIQTVYVKSALPGLKIAGILLLCGAFLTLLLMGIFVDALLGFCMAVPLAACGAVCLTCVKNVGLKCVWSLYLPCWVFGNVIMGFARGTISGLFRICVLLGGLALTIVTFHDMRTGKLRKNMPVTVLMVLMLLITAVGMLPVQNVNLRNPFISEQNSTVMPAQQDGTKVTSLPDQS